MQRGGRFQADPLEQYVLIEPGKIGCAGISTQGFGYAAYLLALAVVLGAVGEGGIQGDGGDGALLVLGSCPGSPFIHVCAWR